MGLTIRTSRTVMGIDIGLANTGVALFNMDADGNLTSEVPKIHLIRTQKAKNKQIRRSSDDLARVGKTASTLFGFIEDCQPSFIFAEIPSGSQSSRASFGFGTCLGVLAAIEVSGNILIQVTPKEVKSVHPLSAPSKREMIDWAVGLYPEADWIRPRGNVSPMNEHMADAIATVHAGVQNPEFRRIIKLSSRLLEEK